MPKEPKHALYDIYLNKHFIVKKKDYIISMQILNYFRSTQMRQKSNKNSIVYIRCLDHILKS